VDAYGDDERRQVQDERGHDPGQDRAHVVTKMEHPSQAGDEQRADEGGYEQGVDDRPVDRLERADEGSIVGVAETGQMAWA
jgi:hypothetical protein